MLSYVLPEQAGRQLDRLTKVLRMASMTCAWTAATTS
jgi:hypothetical protein